MPLEVTVTPGFTFDDCSFGKDEMNRAASPTIKITGSVGAEDLDDGIVGRCTLKNDAFFYAVATGTAAAYVATPCVETTNLVEAWIVCFKVPVTNTAGVSLKVGATAVKNLTFNGINLGAGYLKKDEIVYCTYNSTTDSWEVFSKESPFNHFAQRATAGSEGAPGVLPPAPAGSQRIYTSRKGWQKVVDVLLEQLGNLKNAWLGLPANPYLCLRTNSSGNDVEWSRGCDFHSVSEQSFELTKSAGPWDPTRDPYQEFTLATDATFPAGVKTIVCEFDAPVGDDSVFYYKETGMTGYRSVHTVASGQGGSYPFILVRLDDDRKFTYLIGKNGTQTAMNLIVKGYII